MGLKLRPDVIEYIAMQVTSNIRELEGALVRLIIYASMNQASIDRRTAVKALSDVFAPSDLELSMEDILQATARHFEVATSDLLGKGRRHELVVPRQVAMYLMRDLTEHSFPEIGQFFFGRDHSTVMYAVQKVGEQVQSNDELRSSIRHIKESLF